MRLKVSVQDLHSWACLLLYRHGQNLIWSYQHPQRCQKGHSSVPPSWWNLLEPHIYMQFIQDKVCMHQLNFAISHMRLTLPHLAREIPRCKWCTWWLQRVRILLLCHGLALCLHEDIRKGSGKTVTAILLPETLLAPPAFPQNYQSKWWPCLTLLIL